MTGAELAVIEPDARSIEDLSEAINREHQLALASANKALGHAIAAGEALLAVQAQIGLGGWTAWVNENVRIDETTMQGYMRIATYKNELAGQEILPKEER